MCPHFQVENKLTLFLMADKKNHAGEPVMVKSKIRGGKIRIRNLRVGR
ncbi:MAG: hypothetical protein OP8BY_1174 [Candidatus Saccharicenans subterraneus]|uniref:Uncharacterized protein n=1 Tax=Candidatus Saccharicenans subterraneus TaxID=2508984 RepID=A0A3E2BJV7_9BACT|nr:MAG: hypothetical protein OP8BY_1174 [Candidatus Saccharicenans subterraneum]